MLIFAAIGRHLFYLSQQRVHEQKVTGAIHRGMNAVDALHRPVGTILSALV